MQSTSRALLAVVVAAASVSAPAAAQQGGFPWKDGDPSPAFAGFRLGQDLAAARASMRGTIDTDTLGSGAQRAYAYTTRDGSLSIVGAPREGVGIIVVRRRELGAVDGVRVGDACAAVIERWGPPPRGDSEVGLWVAGKWLVSARCDDTGHVSELTVGNVG